MPKLPALPELPLAGEHIRPLDFAQHALATIEVSEGRRKKRKRNTTPDAIGLEMKRQILNEIAAADPGFDGLEELLLSMVLRSTFPGPLRALCSEVLDEYRLARISGEFRDWLFRGAPSDDREERPADCEPGTCVVHDHGLSRRRNKADD